MTIICQACQALMVPGGTCEECGHEDDATCTCDHFLMQDDDEEESEADDA